MQNSNPVYEQHKHFFKGVASLNTSSIGKHSNLGNQDYGGLSEIQLKFNSFSIQQISIEYLICERHYRHWTVSMNSIGMAPALWIL